MAEEIDPHMVTRLLTEMTSTNRMLGTVASGLTGQAAAFSAMSAGLGQERQKQQAASQEATRAADKWWDDRRSATNGFFSSTATGLSKVGASSNSLLQDISKFSEGFIVLGGIVPALIRSGTELVENWQKLQNAGVGFAGGIMEMGKAAAESGTTLSEFVRMSAQNANSIAQLGGAAVFGKLALTVRKNSDAFGQFGYTVSQMNDLTGEYLKTLGSSTSIQGMNTEVAASSISNLAKQTTILASAYGKSRDEITRISEDAQRSSALIIANAGMSVAEATKFKDTVGAGITAFAAMPGQAGAFMAKLSADIAAHRENPLASGGPEVDLLVKAGLASQVDQIANVLDRMKAGPEAGEENFNQTKAMAGQLAQQIEQMKSLYKWDRSLSDSLAPLLTGLQQASKANYAQAAANQENMDRLTKALGNYQSKWEELSGRLRVKLYDFAAQVMDGIMKGWDTFNSSGGYDKLTTALKEAGEAIFGFFGKTFSGSLAENVSTFMNLILEGATSVTHGFTSIIKVAGELGLGLAGVMAVFATLRFVAIPALISALMTGPGALVATVIGAGVVMTKFMNDYAERHHDNPQEYIRQANPDNPDMGIMQYTAALGAKLKEAEDNVRNLQNQIQSVRDNGNIQGDEKERQVVEITKELTKAEAVLNNVQRENAPASDPVGAFVVHGFNSLASVFKSGEENDRDMIAAIKASPRGTTDSIIQLQNMLADSQDQLQAAGNQGNARLLLKVEELKKALTDQTDVLAGLTAQSLNALDAIKSSSSTTAQASQ